MNRRWTQVLGLGILAAFSCKAGSPSERFEFEKPGMGTLFRISLYAQDFETARSAAERAFTRMQHLERELSDWDADSAVRKLPFAGGRVNVSQDLWDILFLSIRVAEATKGAFDPTVGPVVKLWRRASRQQKLPATEDIEAALEAVGWGHMDLIDETEINLGVPGMRLDFGGIGKGFALDAMLGVLGEEGIASALVDGGGDVAVSNPPPGQQGWRVAIESPPWYSGEQLRLLLANQAIASSGTRFRKFQVDGRTWSHLLDPRTGMALDYDIQATALAPSGALADSLASAACVLGPEGWQNNSLASKWRGVKTWWFHPDEALE